MLTISGLPSRGQWDARRATSSPYLFAEPITAITTASETRLPGGSEGLSILSRHRECCGSQPGASHKNDARFRAGGPVRDVNTYDCPHANRNEDTQSSHHQKRKYRQMAKKTERPTQHPDDLMAVSICLTFQAKRNLDDDDDPPPLHTTEIEETFTAAEAADYLEKVVGAIRERRLYGLMLQEQAEAAVGAGQWIKQTIEEVVAEATAENVAVRLPDVQRFKVRHYD